MNIVDIIDRDLLESMVAQRYVNRQSHPDGGLLIWNYSHKAQFDNLWNDATTTCRGLITDLAGEIVARPFRKFFNLSQIETLPDGPLVAFDKMDGSLGIIYPDTGSPAVATRGSFTSDQALWATKWLNAHPGHADAAQAAIDDGVTLLVEIIYPDNRIVVNYGDRAELVLLAAIDNETGRDVSNTYLWPGATAQPHPGDLDHLMTLETPDAEGFVLLWGDGTRAKVKFAEYLRLHKILCGVNARTIWELLANGQPMGDLIELVPDEFYRWLMGVTADLLAKFQVIKDDAAAVLATVPPDIPRRDQAEIIKTSTYPGVVFALLDGQDDRASTQIWRMIRPEASKPFREDDAA